MNEDVYIRHYDEVSGFRKVIKDAQKARNQLIGRILNNLQRTVEAEQFRKYKSVANLTKSYFMKSGSSSPKIDKK
jgi:hypothetical protein